MGRRLWTWPRAALLTGLVAVMLPLAAPDGRAAEARVVPVPDVEAVPMDAGIRMAPHRAHFTDIPGYVEQEYFISGTAKSYGASTTDADYKTRIYVLRPEDPTKFNGSVMVEWNNVTGQIDSSPVWYVTHEYLIREGYAFVGVAAQKAGHEPGPLALKPHDPVRYGSLNHPGDDYSWDMFSQAGQAILQNPTTLGGLKPKRLIATGQSQSGGRLGSYLRSVHQYAMRDEDDRRVFDGVMPMTAGTGYNPTSSTWVPVPDDLGPVFWVNSQNESGSIQQPDSGDFRLIEIAGAPHFSWWGLMAGVATGNRNDFGTAASWNRDSAGQSGENGGGPCPRGFFPDRYAYAAAIGHMNNWLRSGIAPKSWPRIDRVPGTTTLATDPETGNVTGGFRLPAVDAPVAKFTTCTLFGQTQPLSPDVMARRYPTHAAYVEAVKAALANAIADGTVLAGVDEEEIIARAEASNVGTTPTLVAVP